MKRLSRKKPPFKISFRRIGWNLYFDVYRLERLYEYPFERRNNIKCEDANKFNFEGWGEQ